MQELLVHPLRVGVSRQNMIQKEVGSFSLPFLEQVTKGSVLG